MTNTVDARQNLVGVGIVTQSLGSGATNGTGVDISGTTGPLTFVANVGAMGGTSPTLDLKVQESDTLGSGYADVTGAAFTQITAQGSATLLVLNHVKKYVRVVGTIGGSSTPTALTSVTIHGQKRITSSNSGSSVSPQS